ncbi:MAG: lipocalin-like domain-containing protein [Alphaproteobacteria bacterium]|nr:lipocalin-like domain-containing protein [Alphaproteobacteria bacterium]
MSGVVGVWRLVKASATGPNGEALPPPYGGQPTGSLTLTAEGRMLAVTCDGRRDLPAGSEREYNSYCGNYSFDGKTLITKVDAAANQAWIGGEQVRAVTLEGKRMVLRPPLRPYGSVTQQRVLTWERVG